MILQNRNGPCPLMSIANVLLLRGKIDLSEGIERIDAEGLLNAVALAIINATPDNLPAEHKENFARNQTDALDRLPSLVDGLNVNIYFNKVDRYEFTNSSAIFDVLGVSQDKFESEYSNNFFVIPGAQPFLPAPSHIAPFFLGGGGGA